MNGHFIGFRQLVQNLEWIKSVKKITIISTLQDKRNGHFIGTYQI